jgi:hypothetical protein
LATILEALKRLQMNNHNSLSIFFGSALSIFSYVIENPFIQNSQEFIKIIIFGLLGGIFGYVGKLLAIKIHKLLKG